MPKKKAAKSVFGTSEKTRKCVRSQEKAYKQVNRKPPILVKVVPQTLVIKPTCKQENAHYAYLVASSKKKKNKDIEIQTNFKIRIQPVSIIYSFLYGRASSSGRVLDCRHDSGGFEPHQ